MTVHGDVNPGSSRLINLSAIQTARGMALSPSRPAPLPFCQELCESMTVTNGGHWTLDNKKMA